MKRSPVLLVAFVLATAALLTGCSHDPTTLTDETTSLNAADKEAPSAFGNCLSMPVVWAEGHGLTGADCGQFTGLRGTFGVESFVEPYDATLIDGLPVYRNPSVNEWQAESADGSAWGEIPVELDWADNMTRQTWTDKSKVRVEVVLFHQLAAPLTGYSMYSLGGEQLDEVFVTNTATYAATEATVYTNVARLTIEKLDGEGGTPVFTVYDSPCYEAYFVDGPTDAYSAEVNMGGKCIYGFNWDVRSVPLATRTGWYRLTFGLDAQASYVDVDGAAHVYPRNTLIASLNPYDLFGASDPEVVLYQPALAADGCSSTLDIFIKAGSGGGKGSRKAL